ncbi:MAG: hypothetical protein ACI81R_002322 [Bradymonadia bacterium]|jgi:hypothetical protein
MFQHASAVQPYLGECRAPAHPDRSPVLKLRDRVAALALRLAVAAQATGALKSMDPRVSALIVVGTVESLALALYDDPDLPDPSTVIVQLIEILLDGVFNDG